MHQSNGGIPLSYQGVSFMLACLISFSFAESDLDFNRDIRPILSENCYYCHGADEQELAADLRLDRRERAIDFGAIVPGKPEESSLIARVLTLDPEDIMPPPESHKTLTQEQKNLLVQWVKEGAVYDKHWSFKAVESTEGVTVDSIVERGLAKRSLQLSSLADKETLLKRVTLDLTGLPPTLEEREAFLADASESAYETVVTRLLDSPHYGERMAVEWLDSVRFADTVGYHGDVSRDATPYRDYVIESFNENKSYKDFTIEQIAGDLMPDATLKQKIAASYNRLNQMSQEGGIQNEEYVKKYQAERVRTTATAWLGLTVACAECHDHKFDPITAKDFYSMAAFFADIYEAGAWTGVGKFNGKKEDIKKLFPQAINDNMWFGHELKVPNDTFVDPYSADTVEINAIKAKLRGGNSILDNEYDQFINAISASAQLPKELDLQFDSDPQDANKKTQKISLAEHLPVELLSNFYINNINSTLAGVGVNSFLATFKKSNGEEYRSVVYWGVKFGPHIQGVHSQKRVGDVTQTAIRGDVKVPMSFFKAPSGSKLISIEVQAPNVAKMTLTTFKEEFEDRSFTTQEAAELIAHLTSNKPLSDKFRQAYFVYHAPASTDDRERLTYLAGKTKGFRTVPATLSSPEPREVKILPRGDWKDTSGEVVLPASLHFLPNPISSTAENRLTRLDFANWLVDARNPLTARNYVNRLWQMFFGKALSEAPEDLGLQGYYPEYPELLDQLAGDFMNSGWDIKAAVRAIVLSKVYRQESFLSDEMKETDPYNKLLARQSARRLPAEFIRDNALSTSGLLSSEIYGKSIRPYQPEGHYAQLNFPARQYVSHADERQYRRGVYMHWQRTFLHPMLVNFDAPARDECYVSRAEANTPLQALNLLNDPTFVEAAKALAERVMLEGDEKKVDKAFQYVLLRDPSEGELSLLKNVFESSLQVYTQDSTEADKLLGVGLKTVSTSLPRAELAALTQTCRALYNLHESITRY